MCLQILLSFKKLFKGVVLLIMMKRILALSLVSVVLALSACNNNTSSNILAETKVGNISVEELYTELKMKYGDQVDDTFQTIVLTKVLSDKFSVSEEEIDEVVDKDKENLGEQFEQAIEQSQYKTEENYKDAIKLNLLIEKAAIDDVDITDAELKKYYEDLKAEIRASHILVEDEKTASEVKTKLDKGEPFEELVEEYSIDVPTAILGGDIGWIEPGTIETEFEEAAQILDINEFSEPVQTEHGWHIIQLTDKKEKGSFDEIRSELEKEYKLELVKPNDVLRKELKAANIKINDKDLEKMFEAFLTDLLQVDTAEDEDVEK